MTVLEEAALAVNGPRQENYDLPSRNFTRIAALWSPVLGIAVTPQQVALCMNQVKVARLISTPGHHDSIVDIAGYALCYDMLDSPIHESVNVPECELPPHERGISDK